MANSPSTWNNPDSPLDEAPDLVVRADVPPAGQTEQEPLEDLTDTLDDSLPDAE